MNKQFTVERDGETRQNGTPYTVRSNVGWNPEAYRQGTDANGGGPWLNESGHVRRVWGEELGIR